MGGTAVPGAKGAADLGRAPGYAGGIIGSIYHIIIRSYYYESRPSGPGVAGLLIDRPSLSAEECFQPAAFNMDKVCGGQCDQTDNPRAPARFWIRVGEMRGTKIAMENERSSPKELINRLGGGEFPAPGLLL